jgi:hypothetical protein
LVVDDAEVVSNDVLRGSDGFRNFAVLEALRVEFNNALLSFTCPVRYSVGFERLSYKAHISAPASHDMVWLWIWVTVALFKAHRCNSGKENRIIAGRDAPPSLNSLPAGAAAVHSGWYWCRFT